MWRFLKFTHLIYKKGSVNNVYGLSDSSMAFLHLTSMAPICFNSLQPMLPCILECCQYADGLILKLIKSPSQLVSRHVCAAAGFGGGRWRTLPKASSIKRFFGTFSVRRHYSRLTANIWAFQPTISTAFDKRNPFLLSSRFHPMINQDINATWLLWSAGRPVRFLTKLLGLSL